MTGTGPEHADLLPARLYALDLGAYPLSATPSIPANLPAALPLPRISEGSHTMRFFHIIKTGGESLELHFASQGFRLDYSHCRTAAKASGWRRNLSDSASSAVCAAAAAGVSATLCGLNCECCADDARVEGGFHGTLLRSPRAHALSLFSHCHTAHTQNTYGRMLHDVPQYLAEVILRSTESACGTFCGIR